MKLFKNVYFKLGIIAAVFLLSFLIVLPRVPVTVKQPFLNLDYSIGGYYLNLFNGRYVYDLRDFKKGLDLEGGIRVVLKADMSKIEPKDRDNALNSAVDIISRRVNLLGVSEPYIAPIRIKDEYRILVEIPGVDDITSAVNLIGQTAQLKFKKLKADAVWDESKFSDYYRSPAVWEDSGVTGADLKGADVTFSGNTIANKGAPQIQLRFTNEGRTKFSQVAKENVNKPIALFLDEGDYPISMPVVSPDLAKGLVDDPVINGNFDVKSANALSVQIRAGALPIPVQVLEQKAVGATLGFESVNKSFYAGVIGFTLVLIFMLVSYGRLGLLADFGLILYSLVVLALFKIIPVVLTLPGIAGMVLSIGMATDANILIFERIKEEVLWGRPKNLAIKLGFERAWSSIKDSNISSLITSGVLFYFGTGSVRGFALTLAIGIAVSLFSSIFVVKTLVEVFSNIKVKNADN